MKSFQYNRLFIAALSILVFISCKKNEYNSDVNLPRQFKPGDISVAAGETQAVLEWLPSLFTTGKNASYTVELSKDTLFQNVEYTTVVDTSMATITDSILVVGQNYFARVKANALGTTNESGWVASSSFKITGEQIFFDVLDAELKDTSVILRWRTSPGVTKIVITPNGGTSFDVPLNAADVTAEQKLIKGLTQLTTYKAEIYKNAIKKGTITFTTKEKSIYAVVLSSGDDLVTAVANAANGDIIGLQPGTYDCKDGTGAFANLTVSQKTVIIQSLSGDPTNTKVNFKEVTLSGDGAGITTKGIEWDGTAGNADYFINLTGSASSGAPAVFTDVFVNNCIVHKTNNCFIRANRGSNAGDQKIDTIKVNNTIAYANGTGSYHYFMLDKLQFKDLEVVSSTFYDIARAIISWATNMTAPTPTVLIDHSTINSWGFSSRDNILLDANNNVVNANFQNSIFANTPKSGQSVGGNMVRANTSSTINFSYNNYFNLNTGGATSVPMSFASYVQMSNNQTIDLGWTNATTDFTLPAASPLKTASTTNGPIGDPRWAF